MEHRAISKFWQHYHALQPHIRTSADKQFSLLKGNPQHRSLQFKKIGDRHGEEIYSARVTLSHRALAFKRYMNEASDKHQKFLNYLIEHQILERKKPYFRPLQATASVKEQIISL